MPEWKKMNSCISCKRSLLRNDCPSFSSPRLHLDIVICFVHLQISAHFSQDAIDWSSGRCLHAVARWMNDLRVSYLAILSFSSGIRHLCVAFRPFRFLHLTPTIQISPWSCSSFFVAEPLGVVQVRNRTLPIQLNILPDDSFAQTEWHRNTTWYQCCYCTGSQALYEQMRSFYCFSNNITSVEACVVSHFCHLLAVRLWHQVNMSVICPHAQDISQMQSYTLTPCILPYKWTCLNQTDDRLPGSSKTLLHI